MKVMKTICLMFCSGLRVLLRVFVSLRVSLFDCLLFVSFRCAFSFRCTCACVCVCVCVCVRVVCFFLFVQLGWSRMAGASVEQDGWSLRPFVCFFLFFLVFSTWVEQDG